ncbi:hypothetical protein G7Y89_g4481 [Cudoniella acicularis]|uniref:C2H2-type domain-containing protein n=1 Tax=Cudoniella acicularis TaxID=354080 RepID=A0A8H4RRI4_9HELO|nr:hypothetical protein G7Y89_g4481 [Cudoniella acicularis]
MLPQIIFRVPCNIVIPVLILLCVVAISFFVTWIHTSSAFTGHHSKNNNATSPPTVPYAIPFIGSAFSFVFKPRDFYLGAVRYANYPSAYGVKILAHTIYFVTGPVNIAVIRTQKKTITSLIHQVFCLKTVFGASPKMLRSFIRDDSGCHAIPHPESNVPAHERIDHFTHVGFIRAFGGDGLSNLYMRWYSNLSKHLENLPIREEWVEFPDIMDFWMAPLTSSLVEALAGPILESLNPNFTRDLLQFFNYIQPLFKRLTWWSLLRAYKLRNSLIKDVEKWQELARAGYTEKENDNGDWDPWWGSRLFRDRQSFHSKLSNWDFKAIAISDLATIWGANVNVHTAAIWTIIEVFKDKNLLERVRKELENAVPKLIPSNQEQNVEVLMSLPLLQSVYAEVLRLRVEGQHVLCSTREDFQLNEWIFPKNNLVLVPTSAAHMNENFWNTRGGQHPLDTFWADRFLVYPDDSSSGPKKKPKNNLGLVSITVTTKFKWAINTDQPVAPNHNFLLGHLLYLKRFSDNLPNGAHFQYMFGDIYRESFQDGGIFYLDMWPLSPLFQAVVSPNAAITATQTNPKLACKKPDLLPQLFKPLAGGPNLFDMPESEWKPWRAIFSKCFSSEQFLHLVPGIVKQTLVYCETLREHSRKGDMFFLDTTTLRFTMDLIGKTILNSELGAQRGYNTLADCMISQIRWQQPNGDINPLSLIHIPRFSMQWWNGRQMDQYVGSEIDRRFSEYCSNPNSDKKNKAIIDLLLQAYIPKGAESSTPLRELDRNFRLFAIRQIRLFVFAGHDSTSSTICYCFHLLSQNPDTLAQLRAEHQSVYGSDVLSTPSQLLSNPSLANDLPYTTAVIKETLRLFPPASASRQGMPGVELIDDNGTICPTNGAVKNSSQRGGSSDPDMTSIRGKGPGDLSSMDLGIALVRESEVPMAYPSQREQGEMAHGCIPCDRSFGSQQALHQHLNSPAHKFECNECERSFGSQQALHQHLNSPTHVPATSIRYIGIPRSIVSPVYATAVRLRFRRPTVDDILRHTETELDNSIVSALIAAALRLLPIDDTPHGIALRTEKLRIKAAEAKHAEDSFCAELSQRGLIFLRESQQQGESSTPDVRFQQPISICGHLCMWLEYKNYFGFRENPFIASKNKKQYHKYATQIGPGAVVYKLGFEIGYVNIDDVMVFREKRGGPILKDEIFVVLDSLDG